jgi:hypothetical protein
MRSTSPPTARRLIGEPLGAEGKLRGSLAAAARSAAPQADAAAGRAWDGWRDACRESQDMAAQPVMSCAKRCRRHDSQKGSGGREERFQPASQAVRPAIHMGARDIKKPESPSGPSIIRKETQGVMAFMAARLPADHDRPPR